MDQARRVFRLLFCAALLLGGGATRAHARAPEEAVNPHPSDESETTGVDWVAVLHQSFEFLGVEHGFRYLTEPSTRHPHSSFFGGYVSSLDNLHGWADGDAFYTNYVGHPMQGAISGFIFIQNDRAYRTVEFGRDRAYWKSRLRATAFAWAYSEQFEIGPLSEATIGNTQAFYPQQGFVDQVATPAMGLAWMIAEDSLDKYVVKRIERHTKNPYVVVLARGMLNPSRSMANMMATRVPWHRDTRLDPWEHYRAGLPAEAPPAEEKEYPLAAPAEFFATARVLVPFGPDARGACVGGGGAAAFRVKKYWEIVGDVSGCNMTHFGTNLSGDSLTYLTGPRWTPRPAERWQPFAQVLIGGRKLTHETLDPVKKAQVEAIAEQQGRKLTFADHGKYTTDTDNSGLALSAGAGVDLKIKPALAFRIAQFDYLHSWHSRLNGFSYADSAQFTSGVVLRFGTW